MQHRAPEPIPIRPPFTQEARRVLARALDEGWGMAYPTETAYALGGNALSKPLTERVFKLKKREGGKPLLLLVDGSQPLGGLMEPIAPPVQLLMEPVSTNRG